ASINFWKCSRISFVVLFGVPFGRPFGFRTVPFFIVPSFLLSICRHLFFGFFSFFFSIQSSEHGRQSLLIYFYLYIFSSRFRPVNERFKCAHEVFEAWVDI